MHLPRLPTPAELCLHLQCVMIAESTCRGCADTFVMGAGNPSVFPFQSMSLEKLLEAAGRLQRAQPQEGCTSGPELSP